jgi:hypothetical protein
VRWHEIAIRLTLIVSLFIAAIYGLNLWIAAPLGLIAVAATAELAIRPYATNGADRLLLACGGAVTVLILVGLGLNLMPWGLTRLTWDVAWAILSIGVLVWRRGLRSPVGPLSAGFRSIGFWLLPVSLIFVFAGVIALAGVQQWNRKPVLAFSLESITANTVVVKIDATSITDRYRIAAISTSLGAKRYLSGPFTIRSGGDGEHILERVQVNVAGVWKISLESASDGTTVRWLKVYISR